MLDEDKERHVCTAVVVVVVMHYYKAFPATYAPKNVFVIYISQNAHIGEVEVKFHADVSEDEPLTCSTLTIPCHWDFYLGPYVMNQEVVHFDTDNHL